jgi:2-polyprenyl-3-methyl-5-hydroxy-6-metoxy-1,4-benzoquinol methylase
MLEVGSGDGFMASLLAPLGKTLITTEPTPGCATHAAHLPRMQCSVTDLPFDDHSFDFVFSSSVLEHVRDREAAFAELRRVLRPDGVMVHLMPSPTWKLLQLAFFYPHLVLSGLELLGGQGEVITGTEDWRQHAKNASWWHNIKQHGIPHVHGEYSNHLTEWLGFHANTWADLFRGAGFDVHACLSLPLYSGYGFGLERLRRMGEGFGLSGHTAFIITHPGSTSPRLQAWS